MHRFKEKELDLWYKSSNRKPLIVWGARQVGKTYILLDLFAKNFKDYVYIDLMKDEDSRNFFNTTIDPKKYLDYIQFLFVQIVHDNYYIYYHQYFLQTIKIIKKLINLLLHLNHQFQKNYYLIL